MATVTLKVKRATAAIVLLLSIITGQAWGEILYNVTDLGNLGDTDAIAQGINASGEVVGFTSTAGKSHAFLWSAGTMIDLGTFGGEFNEAFGINDSGQVVGYSTTADGNGRAFLYSDGTMTDLGTLGLGSSSWVRAINANGEIVGYSTIDPAGHDNRAFLYSDGVMTDLGTLGGARSFAYDINESGQIVGFADISPTEERPFLYSSGVMTPLATFSGAATGINASGQVVGEAIFPSVWGISAFLYSDEFMYNLGGLGGSISDANSINDRGQIVGDSVTADDQHRGWLFSDGVMRDLTELVDGDWTIKTAKDINDSGQIAASGFHGDSSYHALLLTPVPEPEPELPRLVSIANGDWNATGTWSRDVPTPTSENNVVVRSHAVTVTEDGIAESLEITDAGGTVTIDAGVTLDLAEGLDMAGGAHLGIGVSGMSAGQITADGDVSLKGELEFVIDGADPFKAGTYTLITTEGVLAGEFSTSSGLGRYVSTEVRLDGLTYTDTTLVVTIDRDLHMGDANLSGGTDLTDFNVWNANKFAAGTDWGTSDFNGDGNTDLSDFNIWNAHKFTLAGGGAAPAPTQVPEPGSLILLGFALAGFAIRWRRKRGAK